MIQDEFGYLLTEKEVAEKLKISPAKLQQDRFYGKGLPYIRLNRTVRYSPKQLQQYFAEHTVSHEQ